MYLQQGHPYDTNLSDRKTKSSPGASPVESHQFKTECYIENEKEQLLQDGNGNTPDKDEGLKEVAEDELKMAQLGTINFSIDYDKQKTALVVTIIKACDLPVKDVNTDSSDPYIKLQLLPDKRHKVKTRVLRKTLNPIYDEIFTFYGINYNQLNGITLHFVVLSFDRFSRDDIIGEVVYPLSGIELGDQQIALTKEIMPRHIKVRSPKKHSIYEVPLAPDTHSIRCRYSFS